MAEGARVAMREGEEDASEGNGEEGVKEVEVVGTAVPTGAKAEVVTAREVEAMATAAVATVTEAAAMERAETEERP